MQRIGNQAGWLLKEEPMNRHRAPLVGQLSWFVLLFVACATAADRPAGYPNGGALTRFPAAGTDLVQHDLRVDVLKVDSSGKEEPLETLVFDGRMLLERGDPYTNEAGYRQIDFTVKSWEAIAWSKALGTPVIYRLSPDVQQEKSSIVAETKERDFPATFEFNVIFDAFAYDDVVRRKHHGRPKGGGFHRVPPDGNRRYSPTITQFEPTLIEVDHPQFGRLRFRPRDCNDQNSRTF